MSHTPTILQTAQNNNGTGDTFIDLAFGSAPTQGNLMIATIAVRGGTGVTVTPVDAWTLIRRVDNGTTLSLLVYRRVNLSGAASTYRFNFSTSQKAAGGIREINNFDATTPVLIENGGTNASNVQHNTVTVNVTKAQALLVSSFATATGTSGTAYTANGWIEGYDQPASGGSAGTRVTAEGQSKTAGATGNHAGRVDWANAAIGVSHIMAINPNPVHTGGLVDVSGDSNATAAGRRTRLSGVVAASGNSNVIAAGTQLLAPRLRISAVRFIVPMAEGGTIKTSGTVALSAVGTTTADAEVAGYTTFVQDSFTDTDLTSLGAHTSDSGHSWIYPAGTGTNPSGYDLIIENNRARGNPAQPSDRYYYVNATPSSADYDVLADIVILSHNVGSNDAAGVVGRAADTTFTFYMARYNFLVDGWELFYIADEVTATLLGTYSENLTSGTHSLVLRMRGDQISLIRNGVEIIGPITNTALTGAGRAGLYASYGQSGSTGVHIDNFTARIPDVSNAIKTSGAVSLSGDTNAVAVARASKRSGIITLTGDSNFTSTGRRIQRAISVLSGISATSAASLRIQRRTSTLSAEGTATAAASKQLASVGNGQATLSASATLVATSHSIRRGAATLSGESTLTASAREIEQGQSVLNAVGTLTVTGRSIKRQSATLSGDSSFAFVGRRIQYRAASLTANSDLSAAAQSVVITIKTSGTVTLTGNSNLTANLTVGTIRLMARRVLSGNSHFNGIGTRVTASTLRHTMVSWIAVEIPSVVRTSGVVTPSGDSEVTAAGTRIIASVGTGQATLSATSSLAVETRAIRHRAATLSAEGSVIAAAREIEQGQSVLNAVGTMTAAARTIKHRGAALAADSGLTALTRRIQRRSSILSAASNATATGAKSGTSGAVLSASGTTTAQARAVRRGISVLTGVATVTSVGRAVRRASAAPTAASSASVIAKRVRTSQSTLSATAGLVVASRGIRHASATLSGTATATARAFRLQGGQVALNGHGNVTAIGRRITRAYAALSAGSVATVQTQRIVHRAVALSGVSTLTVAISLTRYGVALLSASGTLQATGTLSGLYTPIGGLIRVAGVDDIAIAREATLLHWAATKSTNGDTVMVATKTIETEIGIIATRVEHEL